jgi:hypothetical protein
MCLHSNDGILLWVEVGLSVQRFDRDAIFLNVVGFTLKVSFANVFEEAGKVRGAGENSRL